MILIHSMRQFCRSAAAFMLTGCFLFAGGSAGVSVFADDVVVMDDKSSSSSQESSSGKKDESSGKKTDVLSIDGLFEVTGEQMDMEGEKGKDVVDLAKEQRRLIVGYKQKGALASIHFEMGEKPSLDSLRQQFPSQLDVYLLGESDPVTLNVSWESYGDDYSSTNLNYYFFTPAFDSDEYMVQGLDLQEDAPYIEVVQNALTYDMIDSAPPAENEAAVVTYCTETLGLNIAATCGVLANIYCESGFRTNAIGDGGTSVGICQWHNGRWTSLRNYAPKDWQELKGQLRFMKKELNSGYKNTLDYIKSVSNDAEGAYDAAYYWCMHYEMPDKTVSRSITRGYLAKNVYWPRYGEGGIAETEEDGSNVIEDDDSDVVADDPDVVADDDPDAENSSAEPADVLTEETVADSKETARTEETEADSSEQETEETVVDSSNQETEEEDGKAAGEKWRCISEDGLMIRSEQSTQSEAVGSIPFEGEVTVLEKYGEWAKVSYEDKEGYSKLEFLEQIASERGG